QRGGAGLAGAADQRDRLVRQGLAAVGRGDRRVAPAGDVPGDDPADHLAGQVQVVDSLAARVLHVVHRRDGAGDVRHVLVAPLLRGLATTARGDEGRDLGFGAGEVHRPVAVLVDAGGGPAGRV